MKLLLIRHGTTKGNKEHRYVGSTDEELLTGERERLLTLSETGKYRADIVVVSPMRRCRETAEILFQDGGYMGVKAGKSCDDLKICDDPKFCDDPARIRTCNFLVVDAFKEMDFGVFEYMTYEEINRDPDESHREAYQRYIDTMGETAFPGGESKEAFTERVCAGFRELLASSRLIEDITTALVVHGGTIMALLDRFSYPHKDYFDWRLNPGEAYEAELVTEGDDIRFTSIEKI